MHKIVSEVVVGDVSRQEMYEFMLHCTDEDYQSWWPGMHLAFHTIKRKPNNLGNLVYFDEYVGSRRLRFHAVVAELEDAARIVWQMRIGFRLPARVKFELEEHPEGVLVRHTLAAGYSGIGRVLDPLLKLYLSEEFARELDQHARTEFPMLAALLASRRAA